MLLFVLAFGCLCLLLCDAAFFAVFVLVVVGSVDLAVGFGGIWCHSGEFGAPAVGF